MFLNQYPATAGARVRFSARQLLIVIWSTCLVLFCAAPAGAKSIKLAYQVSLLGVEIYEVDLNLSIQQNTYVAKLALKSSGMAGFISGGRIDATSSGGLAQKTATPQRFSMKSNTFVDDRELLVKWVPGASPKTRRNYKLEPKVDKAISKALSAATKDPFSLLITHMALPAKNACSGGNRVYTGRAVYDYSLVFQGTENFTTEDGIGFQGSAFKCKLTYRRIAGSSGKLIELLQDDTPSPVIVWYAPLPQAGPGLLMPVAAITKVSGQTVKITLR